MNLASVHRPFYIRCDLPLEKNKLRSPYKLPLLPGILAYFHYDNMICVCVNARGEAAEGWQRAPSPWVLGECLKHELSCSLRGVIHFHKQIHSDIKKRRSGALVSKVFTVSTRQLLHKGLFMCWISKLVPMEGVENIWAILGFWYSHKSVFSSVWVSSDRNSGLCISASSPSSLINKYPLKKKVAYN